MAAPARPGEREVPARKRSGAQEEKGKRRTSRSQIFAAVFIAVSAETTAWRKTRHGVNHVLSCLPQFSFHNIPAKQRHECDKYIHSGKAN